MNVFHARAAFAEAWKSIVSPNIAMVTRAGGLALLGYSYSLLGSAVGEAPHIEENMHVMACADTLLTGEPNYIEETALGPCRSYIDDVLRNQEYDTSGAVTFPDRRTFVAQYTVGSAYDATERADRAMQSLWVATIGTGLFAYGAVRRRADLVPPQPTEDEIQSFVNRIDRYDWDKNE